MYEEDTEKFSLFHWNSNAVENDPFGSADLVFHWFSEDVVIDKIQLFNKN